MREYKASTRINASIDDVWAVLTDVASYPEWYASCESIEGKLMLGQTLVIRSKLSPGRAFKAKVSQLDSGHKMVWSGGLPLGLFKGVRTFILTAPDSGVARILIKETFSGPLLALIGGSLPDLTDDFKQFCAGLKARVEGG